MKTISNLYEDYVKRHKRKQKHEFSHFIRVLSSMHHHREFVRPKIEWLSNVLNK